MYSERPSANTHQEVEQPSRIATGEEDRKPGNHDGDDCDDRQHRQRNEVRNRQEPLHEWQPTVQVLFDVRIVDFQRRLKSTPEGPRAQKPRW